MSHVELPRCARAFALFMALLVCAEASAKIRRPAESVESKLRFSDDDESGNERKALRAEIMIQKSEKKAITQLRLLIKKNAGKPMEPELLFRLAELYMRRARSQRFFEAHRTSEEAIGLAPEEVKSPSEKTEIKSAIAIYEDLQLRFPRFRSMDLVLFNEAFAHQQLAQNDAAEVLFDKVTVRFPLSPVAPDAWLSLGEIAFQGRKFELAHGRFLRVKAYRTSRAYPYALYKAAWCLYNMQDAAGAMKQLEEVVALGREFAREKRDAKLDLRKEALSDLALFYGDVMPASKAVEYFRAQAQELDPAPYVMRLIEIYKRHARHGDVEIALKDFLRAYPESPLASGAQEELVWNFERSQKRAEAVAELEHFRATCTALREKDPRRRECIEKVADASKKLAGKWHALWKKRSPTEELAASAERAYALYFSTAKPSEADAPQARYSYGELLFQRGKNREASAQYEMAAALGPAQPLAHDAAYAAIVSLEKAVEGAAPADGAPAALWSAPDETRFRALADAYVKANPTGRYELDVRFKRAFIAYEKGRHDEAAVEFKKIGWGASPDGPKTAKAQDLYLDVLNLRKDFKGLKEAAKGLLVRPGLADERRISIEKVYRESWFAEIQSTEDKGDAKSAVAAYKAFAVENKSSDLGPKAWWNASQLLFKIGDAQGGAAACYQMHKIFPSSSNAKDCLSKAAETFEAMGRLDLAARVLLSLAQADSGNEAKWRELAADFLALSGGRDRALAMYEKLSEGQAPARKLALAQKIAGLAKAAGDTAGYVKARSRVLALGIEPQATDAAIEELEERFAASGDQTEAFNAARRILGRDGASASAKARARFLQAQVLEDEFRRQSVKARPERLATVLAIKTEKLEKAQSALQSTIRYGDARTSTQALRRLAGLYRSYAESLRAVAAPDGFNAADAEAFKGEIERLATPLEEKGVESLSLALEAAKKAKLRDGTIGEVQRELDRANMKKTMDPAAAPMEPAAYVPKFTAAWLGGDR